MLILGRKKGEAIVIGDKVRITVQEIGSDGVKLAIDAPRDIRVLRSELQEAELENRQAAASFNAAKIESLQIMSMLTAKGNKTEGEDNDEI